MNKRVVFLTAILLTLITVFIFKIYMNTKKELKETFNRSVEIEKKAKEIIAIQNLKKITIPKFCKKNGDKIICTNLNRYKFYSFQNLLKKAFIKKFEIKKDKNVNAFLEVER